jgi:YjzC-like protein
MSKQPLRPGQTAPASAQYREIGPRGGEGREVTVPRGSTLPPTTKPNSTYRIADRTDNRSGRGK